MGAAKRAVTSMKAQHSSTQPGCGEWCWWVAVAGRVLALSAWTPPPLRAPAPWRERGRRQAGPRPAQPNPEAEVESSPAATAAEQLCAALQTLVCQVDEQVAAKMWEVMASLAPRKDEPQQGFLGARQGLRATARQVASGGVVHR